MGAMEGRLAVELRGSRVVLEPLRAEHGEELWLAAQDPRIWRWLTDLGADRGRFDGWMREAVAATDEGREGVFAIRGLTAGALFGSSRFMAVRRPDRALEIGWTWLKPAAWGTGVNVEAKLLMLRRAFETLGAQRVELKTDARNARSRRAMEALPARFEGVLRKHMIVPTVGVRDSAFHSVIDEEWPEVRANLEARLAGR